MREYMRRYRARIAARSTGTQTPADVKKPAVVETTSFSTFRPVPKPGRKD